MERRAFDLDQVVDGHAFGIGIEVCELGDQSRARAARFAHANDAAAAYVQARLAYLAQRIQPVVLGARRNDLAVKLGRGVQVVVVVVEAGVLQLLGLAFLQHAERGAGFHAEPAHRLDHFDHAVEVTLFGAAPCRAHAKTRRAFFAGSTRCGYHHIECQHVLVIHVRVIARRLRTVTAILRTAAGLDRQ